MELLLAIPITTRSGRRLMAGLCGLEGYEAKIIFHSPEALANWLKRSTPGSRTLVVYAAQKKDLDRLLKIREFLFDHRLILVLPDHDRKTIELGHTLRPNYLTFAGGGPDDVLKVVEHLARKNRGVERMVLGPAEN
jgi:hypothetical protein